MSEENLVDPLDEPGGKATSAEAEPAVEVEAAEVLESPLVEPTDNLDVDVVDEFDPEDFDEDFDDDFEEEIEGEYDLQDDQYGEDFDKEFGHLTDPTRAKPSKAAESKRRPDPKKDKKKKKSRESIARHIQPAGHCLSICRCLHNARVSR